MKLSRVIISGGGTGGHIFPAIAIADEIKRRNPDVELLFVGAEGKMEMEKVPQAGYKIVGLPIVGLQRKMSLSNFLLPFKLIKSMYLARKVLRNFKPEIVIGVGGYASGPTLKAATMLGIPTLVQEQNSFPGKTNKLLASKVDRICVAYEGLEKFFPKEKIALTGNPVRKEMVRTEGKKEEAITTFGLSPEKKTILIIGGSLGARTLNQSIVNSLTSLPNDVQVIWQCGKLYFDELESKTKGSIPESVKLMQFVQRMDLAYAAADLILSRAGAISVSELCIVGKPVILVPSPNVAEDHQTKNAMALVETGAAILIKDSTAVENLIPSALRLLRDDKCLNDLRLEIAKLGKPDATEEIVNNIESIVGK
jgi:UDP-N-acetylglucosamine--N-acetylmuramyl-(pentapeptide) pyrophosphoryl-undecaprenol N-acetylglucosamine transferase